MVSACYQGPANDEFPRYAQRYHVEVGVDDICGARRKRASNVLLAISRVYSQRSAADRDFSRPDTDLICQ
jgi:hypothetical protein